MMNLAKDMIMRIKPQDFKFDVLTVAGYANPKAKTHFAPSASGFNFKWEWEGKFMSFISSKKNYSTLILFLNDFLMPQLRWLKNDKNHRMGFLFIDIHT